MNIFPNAYYNYRKHRKASYSVKAKAHKVFKNLIEQNFSCEEINIKWCKDFTYLFLADGSKRYNCSIIDLHGRSVVASITDSSITEDLAKRTLQNECYAEHE